MYELGAELRRIGQQLQGEYGALVTMLASAVIVLAAAWSIAKRIGRGARGAWRWARGAEAAKPDDDTIEGA